MTHPSGRAGGRLGQMIDSNLLQRGWLGQEGGVSRPDAPERVMSELFFPQFARRPLWDIRSARRHSLRSCPSHPPAKVLA